MKVLPRIIGYIRPHFGTLSVAVIFMLMTLVFNLLSLGLLMPAVDVVFNPPQVSPEAQQFSILDLGKYLSNLLARFVAQYNRHDVLVALILGILFFTVMKIAASLVNQFLMAKVEHSIMHRLRTDVYRHLQNLSLSHFTEERKGRFISTIINDVRIINDSAMAVVNSIFRDPPTILLFATILFLFDWKLTLFVMLTVPVMGFLISQVGNRLKRQSILSQESVGDMMSILDESLANVRIVKAFGMEEFEVGRFTDESANYARLQRKIIHRRNLASPISELMGVIAVAGILWFVGRGVIMGTSSMTTGGLILYITLITQMMQPLKLFGQMFASIQEGIGAGERVFRLLDTKPRILDKPDAVKISGFNDRIRYEGVTFKYDTGDVVLKNVTLEIKAGERIAIVGPSGGGKSTLVDLLPRFYDPVEGRITIDGKDIRDISVNSLRSLMGIVTQETILFNDSVRNNIAYGRSDLSLDEIIEAAKIANAHTFISMLPNGYDTRIGDRGTKLSGGQRQRISLARAILKNPPILIFDEATSALDTESELLVQEAVERTLAGRTSVVIAHRLSTIQHSDRIVVIEKGVIVEEGKHAELISNSKGTYRRLYELQFQV